MFSPCAEASTTEEPESGKTARPGLCGGCRVTGIPTAETQNSGEVVPADLLELSLCRLRYHRGKGRKTSEVLLLAALPELRIWWFCQHYGNAKKNKNCEAAIYLGLQVFGVKEFSIFAIRNEERKVKGN